MAILKGRTVRGIKDKIPEGYVLGREKGDGTPQLIKISSISGGPGKKGVDGTNGTNGTDAAKVVSLFVEGTMSNAELVCAFATVTAFTLPTSLTGSVAKAGAASTADKSFDIQKNGSSIGSIRFNISATGTFTFASPVSFASGDLLQIKGPTTKDVTLGDVSISLLGS